MSQDFKQRLRWWIGGFVALTLFFTVFGERGLFKIYKLSRELHKLEAKKVFFEKDNVKLANDVQKMKKERAFQERSARETLGLAQDNEIIYEFSD